MDKTADKKVALDLLGRSAKLICGGAVELSSIRSSPIFESALFFFKRWDVPAFFLLPPVWKALVVMNRLNIVHSEA